MSLAARHKAHDRLLADVKLLRKRLRSLTQRIDRLEPEVASTVTADHRELIGRCDELTEELTSWKEVEIGVTTAVADLADAVDAMEADLDARLGTDAASYELAVDRQVRVWRARIDRLRLQGALGALEARDELQGLSHRLDRARGDVLVELQSVAGDTRGIVTELRDDVEDVLEDIRDAVRKAVRDLR